MRIRIVIQKGFSQSLELSGSRNLGPGQPFPPACTLRSRQRLSGCGKGAEGGRYPERSRDKGLPQCPLKDGGATSDSDWPAPGSAPEGPTWNSYHRRLDVGWTQGAKEADSPAGSAEGRLVLRAGVWGWQDWHAKGTRGDFIPSIETDSPGGSAPMGFLPFCHLCLGD